MASDGHCVAISTIVVILVGGVACLAWDRTERARDRIEHAPTSARAQLVRERPVKASHAQPACPQATREPVVITVAQPSEPDAIDREAVARIQSSLTTSLEASEIGASYDLDCTTYPCLAVFTDDIPSIPDRAAVVSQLIESMPDSHLVNATFIGADNQVSWVVVLADGPAADAAAVDARIKELLPQAE